MLGASPTNSEIHAPDTPAYGTRSRTAHLSLSLVLVPPSATLLLQVTLHEELNTVALSSDSQSSFQASTHLFPLIQVVNQTAI